LAVSFLRLHYKHEGPLFPAYGDVEPHPLRQSPIENVGVKFRGSTVSLGGAKVPPAYEVDQEIEAITLDATFRAKADLIFDPLPKSLAERVSQGLGWLTRGRQSEDRAERLLYFFTAIEALLSSDDKSAPVVQTIARHAAVVLSDDIVERIEVSGQLGKLYALRSALVHAGNRSVLWNSANLTQYLAERMFRCVLQKADLRSPHASFNEELKRASYGSPWRASAAASSGS